MKRRVDAAHSVAPGLFNAIEKAAALGINHPGSAAFFEEPTYLDCVNAPTRDRFQYQLKKY